MQVTSSKKGKDRWKTGRSAALVASGLTPRWGETYLNLNGPSKVADIDKERYVLVVAEIKVLIGEAVFELFDVAPRDDGDLLSGLGSC